MTAGAPVTKGPVRPAAPVGKRSAAIMVVYLAIFLLLLTSRRWQQLALPQVWDEDGVQILPGFIGQGWQTFFLPVNGYLMVSAKAISALALGISITAYPLVSTLLCWTLTALVGLAIAVAPTRLRGRFLCALAVFVVPSNPEVFGVPLYSTWWVALLLFLVALWDERQVGIGWRALFLLLGGLSSPIIVLVLPVLWYRAWRFRALTSERKVALLATLVAAAQCYCMVKDGAAHAVSLAAIATYVVPRFFGTFLVGNLLFGDFLFWWSGLLLIAILAACVSENTGAGENGGQGCSPVLLYLLAGSIALTVIRCDPGMLHPAFEGPRYFFYPYIAIYWILIQSFLGTRRRWLLRTVGVCGFLALLNGYPVWSRPHDDLHWASHIRSCRLFPEYNMPVQRDGRQSMALQVTLAGASCEALLQHDIFSSARDLAALPTYAYVVDSPEPRREADIGSLLGGNMTTPLDSSGLSLKGYRVFSSSAAPASREIRLRLHRGEQLLYRSDLNNAHQSISIEGHEQAFIAALPIARGDWSALDFSNASLPADFVLTLRDEGKGDDEWSAVALKN